MGDFQASPNGPSEARSFFDIQLAANGGSPVMDDVWALVHEVQHASVLAHTFWAGSLKVCVNLLQVCGGNAQALSIIAASLCTNPDLDLGVHRFELAHLLAEYVAHCESPLTIHLE